MNAKDAKKSALRSWVSAFADLRLAWVKPQIYSDHAGQVYLISQLNYLSQFFSCHLNNHYAVSPPKSLEQDINIYYFIW